MPRNQMEIPGTEKPVIKEIEIAAEKYVAVRDKRMKLTEQEVAAKTALIEVVQKHSDDLNVDSDGNRCYTYDELIVILSDTVNVKVKHASAVTEPE